MNLIFFYSSQDIVFLETTRRPFRLLGVLCVGFCVGGCDMDIMFYDFGYGYEIKVLQTSPYIERSKFYSMITDMPWNSKTGKK